MREYIEDVDFFLYFVSKEMDPEEPEYSTDSELEESVDLEDFTSSADSSIRMDSPVLEIDVNEEEGLLELEEVNEPPRTDGNNQ